MSKKRNNRKVKTTPKERLLLDTSIQIDKLVPGVIADEISRIRDKQELRTSYYVLYEFKTGLIKVLIEFYLLTKTCEDSSSAIGLWKNKFAKRELKNEIILESVMHKIFNSIATRDKNLYLNQVEGAIFYILETFYEDIRKMEGSFGDNRIVEFTINSKSDYNSFIELTEEEKFMDLRDFFRTNFSSLQALINDSGFSSESSLSSMLTYLKKIEVDLEKANTHNVSKGIGDAVIAIDSHIDNTILTLDNSFKKIAPALGKKHKVLTR